MDVSQALTFLAAAETGSFARAAEIVHASPSSVTERVAALEARLGARLFTRSKRGCELTAAGNRFLPRARDIAALWDAARDEARLPADVEMNLRFGGQYALWPGFLIRWLPRFRAAASQIGVAATAGASARLNRELVGGILDVAVLYDAVLSADVAAEPLLNDRLVLASGVKPGRDWHEHFVRVDWGAATNDRIAAALGREASSGVSLDLGAMAVTWLIQQSAAGYVPERAARGAVSEGRLSVVADAPVIDYPASLAWRRDRPVELVSPALESLRAFAAASEFAAGAVRTG